MLDQMVKMQARGVLRAPDAQELGLHLSQPYLDGLRQRLLVRGVDIDEGADHLQYSIT